MTRCACERDGNPIPNPVAQQQRRDKGESFLLRCRLNAAPAKANAGEAEHKSPRGPRLQRGSTRQGKCWRGRTNLPDKALKTHQEQERGGGCVGVSAEEGTGGMRKMLPMSKTYGGEDSSDLQWYLSGGK